MVRSGADGGGSNFGSLSCHLVSSRLREQQLLHWATMKGGGLSLNEASIFNFSRAFVKDDET